MNLTTPSRHSALPPQLKAFLLQQNATGLHFLANIRMHNSLFSFADMKANIKMRMMNVERNPGEHYVLMTQLLGVYILQFGARYVKELFTTMFLKGV
jgi:hypothetical protein